MGRIYVKNFSENETEENFRTIFKRWNQKISKIDIVNKKDEEGQVISRFCYLTVSDDVLNQEWVYVIRVCPKKSIDFLTKFSSFFFDKSFDFLQKLQFFDRSFDFSQKSRFLDKRFEF